MNQMVAVEDRIAARIDPAIAGALTVSGERGGVSFRDAGQVLEFSKMMAVASNGVRKHLRGNPGACLAICVQAVEWGMSPFAVANKSYFVNDQIAFESQLVQAVILRRAPIKGRIHFEFSGQGESRVCRAWARLRDEPDEIVDYTSPPFRAIQPKNSPLWKSDPDQQHAYMAGRALCRRHFPDVLLGVYADDEIGPAPDVESGRASAAPRGLAGRLDALAAGPAREPVEGRASFVTRMEDVSQDNGADPAAESQDAMSSEESADEVAAVEAEDTLLDRGRQAAMGGTKVLAAWLKKLTAAETDEIEPHMPGLQAAAKQADGGNG